MILFHTAATHTGFSTPKLHTRFPMHTLTFQADEFGFGFRDVWSTYYLDDTEFAGFMEYFLDHACTPPRHLAIEEEPAQLLVCAEQCKHGHAPVIEFTDDGRRVRSCWGPVSGNPMPPKKKSQKRKKKKKKG